MERTPLNKIKTTGIFLAKGNYEGNEYYQVHVELDNGIKLKQKLTAFEYKTLMSQYR